MDKFEFKIIENELKKVGVFKVFFDISFKSIKITQTVSSLVFFEHNGFYFSIHSSLNRKDKEKNNLKAINYVEHIKAEVLLSKAKIDKYLFKTQKKSPNDGRLIYCPEKTLCDIIVREVLSISRIDFESNSFNPVGFTKESNAICSKVNNLRSKKLSPFEIFLQCICEYSKEYSQLLKIDDFIISDSKS